MIIEGTRKAFETLISQRGISKLLGVETSTVSTWKAYLREGKNISIDKMEEMLTKSGATYRDERMWKIPTPATINFKLVMMDFHVQLKACKIGDELKVNYSDGTSEVLVNNSLNYHAMKLGCLVERDDNNRPRVTYRFIN